MCGPDLPGNDVPLPWVMRTVGVEKAQLPGLDQIGDVVDTQAVNGAADELREVS